MNKIKYNKDNHRNTELGWIPKDWKIISINKLGKIYNGGTPDTSINSYWNGNITWYTPTEVSKSGKFIDKSERKITKLGLQNSSANIFPKNTIVITTRASIGDVSISKIEACTNQGFKNLYVNGDNDFEFIYYKILTLKNLMKSLSSGSTFLELSMTDFKNLKLALPPLPEQQKIAQILSTWDKAIAQQEQLITQKKQLKKAMMQQLLTAKLRFPGFDEEWEEFRLEEVFKHLKGIGLSKEKISENGKFECVLYGDLYTKYKEQITEVIDKTNFEEGTFSEIGDILIPSSTTTTGIDLAKASSILVKNVRLGGDITILRSKKDIESVFYSYYLTNIKKYHLARYSQGITIIHLYFNHFKNLIIEVPNLKEQKKIAQFLTAMDAEIDLLQTQLSQLQTQKKGLMQVLLTGEIRVKV